MPTTGRTTFAHVGNRNPDSTPDTWGLRLLPGILSGGLCIFSTNRGGCLLGAFPLDLILRSLAGGLLLPALHFLIDGLAHGPDQLLHVRAETVVRERGRVSADQGAQVLRKLIRPRHRGVVDQDGNHPLAVLERGTDLDADKVVGVLELGLSVLVDRREPSGTDDRKQYVASAYPIFQDGNEIKAGLDAVHVHEHAIPSELRYQPIVQTTGVPRGIFAAVVDENPAFRGALFGPRSGLWLFVLGHFFRASSLF